MAHGDIPVSPWVVEFEDYLQRKVSIVVNYDNVTRAVINAIVHRDSGCMFTKIVFDVPSDGVKSKRLAAPVDGAGDRTYTAAQLSSQGLNTIEDCQAVQITAEP